MRKDLNFVKKQKNVKLFNSLYLISNLSGISMFIYIHVIIFETDKFGRLTFSPKSSL